MRNCESRVERKETPENRDEQKVHYREGHKGHKSWILGRRETKEKWTPGHTWAYIVIREQEDEGKWIESTRRERSWEGRLVEWHYSLAVVLFVNDSKKKKNLFLPYIFEAIPFFFLCFFSFFKDDSLATDAQMGIYVWIKVKIGWRSKEHKEWGKWRTTTTREETLNIENRQRLKSLQKFFEQKGRERFSLL